MWIKHDRFENGGNVLGRHPGRGFLSDLECHECHISILFSLSMVKSLIKDVVWIYNGLPLFGYAKRLLATSLASNEVYYLLKELWIQNEMEIRMRHYLRLRCKRCVLLETDFIDSMQKNDWQII